MSLIESSHAWLGLKDEKQSKSRVGREILAWCSNCKMNFRHTIISLDSNNAPYRVQCITCKTERNFRPPKVEGKPNSETQSVGENMLDQDEDTLLEQEERVKKEVFGNDDSERKKSRAKPKAKKAKASDSDVVNVGRSKGSNLPLSMIPISEEDKHLFESKFSAHKASQSGIKHYVMGPDKFLVGDVIDHKTFGIGFVVNEVGGTKIEVLFNIGRKLLVHGMK